MNSQKFHFIKTVSEHLMLRYNFGQEVAEFIGCQFALESDFGGSSIAKQNRNYCGMKVARTRISTQLSDDSNGFGVYNSLDDCILDFVLRMQYFRPISDDYKKLGCYKKFNEKSCYCPEKTYNTRIDSIYKQFKNFKNE